MTRLRDHHAMRLVVLGGTRFIGRAVVEELVAAGHRVAVVHRGDTEPDDWVDVEHLHVDRRDLAGRNAQPTPLTEKSEVREHRSPHPGGTAKRISKKS